MSPLTSLAHPSADHGLARRHYFTCGGDTLSWERSWYTESFYTQSSAAYDSAASLGPVNPPLSVWYTLCPALEPPAPLTITSPGSPTSTSSSLTSASLSISTGAATGTGGMSAQTSITPTLGPVVTRSSDASRSSLTTMDSLSLSMSSLVSSSVIPPTQAPLAAFNSNAGSLDFQAAGAGFAAALTTIAGALAVGLWVLLRGRLRMLYAPRSWFLSPVSRPASRSWSATLLPFLALPSLASPTSEAMVMSHVGAAMFALMVLSLTVAVGVVLPLSVAGLPHLSETSPSNTRGGHLGSITDLSLLRLLNALDPSPESQNTQHMLRLRALPSTIASVAGTRARLIAVVVVVCVVWVGGALCIIAYTYTRLSKYSQRFDEACEGQEMVFVPASKAAAWRGLTETGIRRRLLLGPADEASVAGVFAIGLLSAVRELVREREFVLHRLERAEAKFIKSFPTNIASPTRPASTAGKTISTRRASAPGQSSHSSWPVSAGSALDVPSNEAGTASTRTSLFTTASDLDFMPQGNAGSAFLEVDQRQSVLLSKGKLHIGDRVVRDDDGTFLPDPTSPPEPDSRRESYLTQPSRISDTYTLIQSIPSRPQSSLVPGEMTNIKADITWSRRRLQKLNANADAAQQKSMAELASGEGVVGWIVVGRGVRSLPFAQPISGPSKEDIVWDNLGEEGSVRAFWWKVTAVAVAGALILIPFMGLAVASAPGFARRLRFLDSLARGSNIASGVVESFVPAVALSSVLILGILVSDNLSWKTKPVSYMARRFLVLQAAFYLLLGMGTIWLIAVIAIEYGVDAFAVNVQKARAVGDGAIYSGWFSLVFVSLFALLVPGVMLLQPHRVALWMWRSRTAITPREKFRISRPPDYDPVYALAPVVVVVLHCSLLSALSPLIAIPALLLALLSLVAQAYLTSNVWCISRGGPSDGASALWLVRRLGWGIALQPALLGLAIISRNEWAIGGTAVAIGVLAIIASESVTVLWNRQRMPDAFTGIDLCTSSPVPAIDLEEKRTRFGSDHSILATLHTLLPGLSRLPTDNPLPLSTDAIDDMHSTGRAVHANPHVTAELFPTGGAAGGETSISLSSPADQARGLLYPPALLAPAPEVWLPRDEDGIAQQEAASLAAEGLVALIDLPRH